MVGLAIALILNIPMRAVESKLSKKISVKLRRLMGLILTILLLLTVILLALLTVIPEIVQTFEALLAMLPGFIDSVTEWVWFIMLFLALQQVEGNLIYPRVIGSSVGLHGLWVMLAVIIGGGMMGVTGMLISVPLCSVFYVLLRESIGKRLAKKCIPIEKM